MVSQYCMYQKNLLKVSFKDIKTVSQGIALIYLMILWLPTLESFSSKFAGLIRAHLQNLYCLDFMTVSANRLH